MTAGLVYDHDLPEVCTHARHVPGCPGRAGGSHQWISRFDRTRWQRTRRSTPVTTEDILAAAPRFWSKVGLRHEDPTRCWVWIGATNYKGYGDFYVLNRRIRAHRYTLLIAGQTIPDGMTVDHLCRNPRCVRPAHLEVVTMTENTLRGTSFSAVNKRKTHCPQGHEYTPDNTVRTKQGRKCRTCFNASERRRTTTPEYRARRNARLARKRIAA